MVLFLLTMILAPTFVALLAAHKVAAGCLAWGMFSAVVDGMPAPTGNSRVSYRWLYGTLHLFACNLVRVFAAVNPTSGRLLQMPRPSPFPLFKTQ